MGSNSSAAKCYIRSVSGALSCTGNMKKRIVSQIRDSVEEYMQENPNADLAMVQAHFGTPQEIAASYVDEQDRSVLLKKLSIRKRILAIVAGVMAVILLMWVGFVIWETCRARTITFDAIEVIVEKA